MILTITVPPAVERALEEKARQSGQSLPEYAAAVLAQVAGPCPETASADRQAEIAARLKALQQIGSCDNRVCAGLPPLSDEAISRESIYEGRSQF